MKLFRNSSPFWTVIAAITLLFLSVQIFFVDHRYTKEEKQVEFPENRTIFFTVKESQPSLRKKGFDTLKESLKLWEYDEEKKTVYLREISLMPTKYTPLLVIYDNGYDSYEKQENIVPISSFPFSLKDSGTSLQINQINKSGKVYFQYRDKELSLEPGEVYRLPYFDGFRLKLVTIKNHGLFKTKQFKVLENELDKKE